MAMKYTEVNITPKLMAAKSYVPSHKVAELRTSGVIIVPHDSWPGHDGPLFPQGTIELAEFLRDELPEDVKVTVPVSEDKYEEIGLYSGLVVIGTVLVMGVVLPVVANVLAHFITKKLESRSFRPQETDVRLTLIVCDEDHSLEFHYEGKPGSLCAALRDAKRKDEVVHALEALADSSNS